MTEAANDGPEDNLMSIQDHTFCWHGIATDIEKGKAFYTGALGWKVEADGEGAPMFVGPGGAVAHIQAPEAGPPAWCSFLSVEDVDASTAKATAHGGTLLVEPTNLPAGRFSVVTTPTGAVFGLYQAVDKDELAKPGPGSIHWVELQSTAPQTDIDWLKGVFGFSHKTEDMAMGPYHVLEANGEARGGVSTSAIDRSVFIAWVEVADLDQTLAKVNAHGGKTLTDTFGDPAVGRMAVVSDPSGATFGLVQPLPRP